LPTFVAVVVAQPRGRERPRIEYLLEAIYYKRLSANNHVQQDELLKLLNAIAGDHLIRDAVDILEVFGLLHKGADVEIGRYGLK
jgi:hypothetical protein